MTIYWIALVPGVLLLLFPADRLLSSLVELRSFDCFQHLENSARYRPWWWVPALWVDPVRGFAGTWLLQHAFGLASATWAAAPKLEYGCLVALLGLGVLCQTFTRRGDERVILAPVGFVAGMLAALMPWPVTVIGLVTAALGLFAFRQFHAFFGFGMMAVAILGFVLEAPVMWLWPAAGALALPLMTGLVTGSTLEVPTRNASSPRPRANAAK